jgi:hypothetical protein
VVPATALDIGYGGRFFPSSRHINLCRSSEHRRDFCHILREIAPISPGVWIASKHLSAASRRGPPVPTCRRCDCLVKALKACAFQTASSWARGRPNVTCGKVRAMALGATKGTTHRKGVFRKEGATRPFGLSSARRAVPARRAAPDTRPPSVSEGRDTREPASQSLVRSTTQSRRRSMHAFISTHRHLIFAPRRWWNLVIKSLRIGI